MKAARIRGRVKVGTYDPAGHVAAQTFADMCKVSAYQNLVSFWDHRQQVPAPGFHALVIGVSRYPYLAGGGSQPAAHLRRVANSLKQLSGPAKTAADLALWLTDRRDKLTVPLRTCRLLVSPDPSEPAALQNLKDATYQDIKDFLWDWHNDLNDDPNGAGLLYFAGHGIQKDRSTPFLLPSDFLGGNSLLDRALDALEIRNGMARSQDFPTMALQQFYFFDACQTDVEEFRRLRADAPKIFDVEEQGADDRVAPIFYATTPGHVALNSKGEGTRFGMDLIECLSNGAAEHADGMGWVVTVERLAQAMNDLTAEAVARAGSEIRRFRASELYKPETVIHKLDQVPTVRCTFRIEPDEARTTPGIALNGRADPHPFKCPSQNPYKPTLTAGFYDLEINPSGRYLAPLDNQMYIQPPLFERTLRFRPST
jgi:Caspase domain